MPIIRMPDGAVVNFPENTPPETIKSAIDKAKSRVTPTTAIQSQQKAQQKVLREVEGGGRIVDLGGGKKGFVSPGYSTTNPREVERIEKGMTPTPAYGRFEEIVAKNPVGARAMQYLKGIPGARGYIDEAFSAMMGPEAGKRAKEVQTAFETVRPVEAMGYQALGGTVTTAPLMVGAAPQRVQQLLGAPQAAYGWLARATPAAVAGGAAAGIEGAVAGYGMGEGGTQQRLQRAGQESSQNVLLGTVFGAATPAVENVLTAGARVGTNAAQYLMDRLRNRPTGSVARELGVSEEAGRLIQEAVEADDINLARNYLARLGPNATLADAGPSAGAELDLAMTVGRRAPQIVEQALEPRFQQELQRSETALNTILGRPQSIEELRREVQETARPVLDPLYKAAYAAPIDYSTAAGQQLEQLLQRVPASAINYANNLMRTRGERSAQILAQVAPDGAVTYTQLPDVRQLDYITRALRSMSLSGEGAGALGGQTDIGSAYMSLRNEMRQTLGGLVPEYRTAVSNARDAITRREATELGESMLRDRVTPSMVVEEVSNMSAEQLQYVRRGLRSAINNLVNNVKQTRNDPQALSQAAALFKSTSSPNMRLKIEAILDPAEARRLIGTLDDLDLSLELQTRIARNSQTARRTTAQRRGEAIIERGSLRTMLAGRPLSAVQKFVQDLTGETAAAQELRKSGIYDEVAYVLTNIQGQQARDALELINRAQQGRQLTQAQQQFIARVLVRPVTAGAYMATVQEQPPQPPPNANYLAPRQ